MKPLPACYLLDSSHGTSPRPTPLSRAHKPFGAALASYQQPPDLLWRRGPKLADSPLRTHTQHSWAHVAPSGRAPRSLVGPRQASRSCQAGRWGDIHKSRGGRGRSWDKWHNLCSGRLLKFPRVGNGSPAALSGQASVTHSENRREDASPADKDM